MEPEASRLKVRPLEPGDVPAIVRYWTEAEAADLDRMGVDPSRVPSPAQLAAALEQVIAIPDDQARTAYMIWLVDGRAVGYSGLKNIRRGRSGEIHLHMWESAARGQGHGGRLFALSALAFYDRFRLREIICEPKADNAMPNRMLVKAGFPLVGSRIGCSSELGTPCLLNVYAIPLEVARRVAGTYS